MRQKQLQFEWNLLVLVTAALVLFGIVMVYSATSGSAALGNANPLGYVERQLVYTIVGVALLVVVSRLETLAAHFGSDEVTFFEPGDADSLAEAARWVASNPQAAKDKAEAARQRAHEYSWRENGARFVDLLASLDRRAYRLARAGGDRV